MIIVIVYLRNNPDRNPSQHRNVSMARNHRSALSHHVNVMTALPRLLHLLWCDAALPNIQDALRFTNWYTRRRTLAPAGEKNAVLINTFTHKMQSWSVSLKNVYRGLPLRFLQLTLIYIRASIYGRPMVSGRSKDRQSPTRS